MCPIILSRQALLSKTAWICLHPQSGFAIRRKSIEVQLLRMAKPDCGYAKIVTKKPIADLARPDLQLLQHHCLMVLKLPYY